MADFENCFSALDFSHHKRVIVAISGGSDSTGLLVLLQEFLASRNATLEIIAVTIDHGLRLESAKEAAWVKALCEKRAIVHVTKHWQGEKPKTGIQAAAREARYRLLMEAAHENGATLILTGHTEDDQFETILMRSKRGEGYGLAGIAPATLAFGEPLPIWFARPFLTMTRAAIRAALSLQMVDWIDDPSNVNPDFERVRVRQALAGFTDGDLARLRQSQAEWAQKRTDLSKRAASMIECHLSEISPGLFLADAALADEADRHAAAEALRVCLAFAGGSKKMIDLQRAKDIVVLLGAGESFRKTGSGSLIDRRKQGLFILRESRNPGKASGVQKSEAQILEGVPVSLVRRALALKVLGKPILNPWPLRVPLFDLAAASALARLAAAEALPPSACSL